MTGKGNPARRGWARKDFALSPGRVLVLGALAAWLPGAALCAAPAAGAEVQFNEQFLVGMRGQNVDASRFAQGNPVSPGEYAVDLYMNGNWVGRNNLRFVARPGSLSAVPCFDKALVARLGLDLEALSEKGRGELLQSQRGDCVDFAGLVDGAAYTFDMSDLRMDLSVPQVAVQRQPRGYVSPEFWDSGVTSATLGYNLNSFRTSGSGPSNKQTYLGLNFGANLGNWHFRHNSSTTWRSNNRAVDAWRPGLGATPENPDDLARALQSGGFPFQQQYRPAPSRRYQNIATYFQRDLPTLRSQLTIGDAFTDGAVFDSIGIRGVSIGSDDRMLPDSQRGYAPLIRGVATTNARVTVTQNGNKLYETTVSPGAFEINDLYATGYGGNLVVTVTEADGSQRSFTVPYASVTQMLRPGITRFNVAAGQLRDAQSVRHDKIVQGTVQHGINNFLTGYAGIIVAQGYRAGLVGTAVNTPVGAVAFDLTQASADIAGLRHTSGQSVRLSYSKLLAETNTNFTLAAYRYSSSGFWSLRDAMLARSSVALGMNPGEIDRQRNQLQLTLNQSLGESRGSVYVAGSTLDYWNRGGTTTQFQVGYNNMLQAFGRNMAYNISLSRQRIGWSSWAGQAGRAGRLNNQLFASISIPLGKDGKSPNLTTSVSRTSGGYMTAQASMNGSAGEDNEFSYGVSTSHQRSVSADEASGRYAQPRATTGSVNGQYRSPYATLMASAGSGSGYSQQSLGVKGALVAHPGGITLANDLGETVGIVEAKGAEGARVTNAWGVRIDGRGYAVIPYLTPYSLNTVQVEPKGLPFDVEFKSTSQQIAPRANAVVMIPFATATGRAAVVSARQPGGAPLPFGADVFDAQGQSVGAIGQNSRIFVRVSADQGVLTVKWGEAADQRCAFDYSLPPRGEDPGAYAHVDAVCSVVPAAAVSVVSAGDGSKLTTAIRDSNKTSTELPVKEQ